MYCGIFLNNVPRSAKLAYMEVYRIMDYLLRLIQSSKGVSRLTNASVISDSKIYKVLYYIERHYAEEVRLDEMIRLAHMSKSSFYRSFKQITGDSFNHYLNKFRTVKAHALIMQDKLPLQKIAEKTGVSSTAHMTRIFREIYGASPSEYRLKKSK